MVKVKISVDTSKVHMDKMPQFKEELLEQTSQKGKQILQNKTPRDTGAAASSYRVVKSKNQHTIKNDKKYLGWVNDGTGVYGPRHTRITPVNSRFLHFTWKGREWFLKSVRGQKGQRFVERSMPEIVESIPEAAAIASRRL